MNVFYKVFSPVLVFACIGLCLPLLFWGVVSHADTGTERQVVVKKTTKEPSWKVKWDRLRELVHQQKYREAARGYSALLSQKANIEEARWEYLQLLMRLQEWDVASSLVDSLIERDSRSIDYRLAGGRVAFAKKELERALGHYGWVFNNSPDSDHGLTALQGLIDVLLGLGRPARALPLLEQLYTRKPRNHELLRTIATLAMQQGLTDKAASYFSLLIDQFPADDRIVFQAAECYEKIGDLKGAAVHWKHYLGHHPGYVPFQKKISDYYLSLGQPDLALPHLLILQENGAGDDDLLLRIATIYLNDQKRPDKALVFFRQYLQKKPDDELVQAEIARIRTVLANDLISIVENDGAWKLWKDLARFTPDRLAIYLSMVDVLTSLGKDKELREILVIIHLYDPGNQEIVLRLAELELKMGDTQASGSYLAKMIPVENNQKRILLVRGKLADSKGHELSALDYFERYLKLNPEDRSIRIRCLELSGGLGLVSRFTVHADFLGKVLRDVGQRIEIEKRKLKRLRENFLFREAKEVCDRLLALIGDDSKQSVAVLLEKAKLLRDQGLLYEAEESLRSVFTSTAGTREALLELVELSLEAGEMEYAWDWFGLLRGQLTALSPKVLSLVSQDPGVTLLHARLLSRLGRDDEAIDLLKKIVFQRVSSEKQGERRINLEPALFLARILLNEGILQKGLRLVKKINVRFPHDARAQSLLRRFKARLAGEEFVPGHHYSGSQLIRLAREALENGEVKIGLIFIQEVLTRVEGSVAALGVKAKLLLAAGRNREARLIFQGLRDRFPANRYFKKNLMELDLLMGRGGAWMETVPGERVTKDEDMATQGFGLWERMFRARFFLVENRYREAIEAYDSMLQEPVEVRLARSIKAAGLQVELPVPGKSFWNILTFSAPALPDLLAIVMDPVFVGKHLGKPIDTLTTELYSAYRWQKRIHIEKTRVQPRIDGADEL